MDIGQDEKSVRLKRDLDAAKEKLGLKADNLDDFCTEIADKLTKSEKTVEIDESLLYNSYCDRDGDEIVFKTVADGTETKMNLKSGYCDSVLGATADAHRNIYLAWIFNQSACEGDKKLFHLLILAFK